MNKPYSQAVKSAAGKTVRLRPAAGFAPETLEVNVIFTDQASTAAALAFAQSLAHGLGACVHLQFAMEVPFQLPLENPGVSVSFLQGQMSKVLADLGKDGVEPQAHLYLCRDRVRALQQALKPNSLVVIGARKRWWPTAESGIARALRAKGHWVMCVDSKAQAEFERALLPR